MGERGPKPLPANVHMLRGNASKLPAGKLQDAVCPPAAIPTAPDHLNPEALEEWKRVTPLLLDLGLITEIDRAALAAYCQAYGRWVNAEHSIARLNAAEGSDGHAGEVGITPSGYKQISVLMQISNRAQETMAKFAAEFGMTPSSRSRVTPSAPGTQGELFGKPGGDAADKYFN